MIYVGVDIAKLKHFASAISSDGEVLIEPFKFTNDADGFQMLVSKLISLNAESDSIIIGLESTAHYGDNLVRYFVAEGSAYSKSVGTSDSALSIQITHSIAQIELLDSQLNKIEEEMTDIMKFNDSVIMTIPGIGYINGGMILGEIGNIHRFSSPGKLLAFAGIDPSFYQSGNFQARRTKMSKCGSKVLRYVLINAAHKIVMNNVTFKTYYDIKMAEGWTHYNAL